MDFSQPVERSRRILRSGEVKGQASYDDCVLPPCRDGGTVLNFAECAVLLNAVNARAGGGLHIASVIGIAPLSPLLSDKTGYRIRTKT